MRTRTTCSSSPGWSRSPDSPFSSRSLRSASSGMGCGTSWTHGAAGRSRRPRRRRVLPPQPQPRRGLRGDVVAEPLLEVKGLSVDYEVGAGTFHALSEVSLELPAGHVVGIVGETGCGKSTLAHAIPRLLREPPARIRSGEVRFRGMDLLTLPKWKLPLVRGTGISMVFQEPINDPETILDLYPHELSGGMRQRIMIAMALSEKPSLLIADEPTSALDITIQAQVLTLMKELIEEIRTSILFISHDLGVIAEMADDVGVMYAGHLVEFGPVDDVYEHPRHPYTKALLRSAPNQYKDDGPLPSLPGSVPNLSRLPSGCSFHPRCPLAKPVCSDDPGPVLEVQKGTAAGHEAACYFSEAVAGLP